MHKQKVLLAGLTRKRIQHRK